MLLAALLAALLLVASKWGDYEAGDAFLILGPLAVVVGALVGAGFGSLVIARRR
ncbi:MAG: hypothetical protein ABR549_01405 [Mycobacteriales bacterium]